MIKKNLNAPKLLFLLSSASVLFFYGLAVGHKKIFPFYELRFGYHSSQQVLKQLPTLTGSQPQDFLSQARHQGYGVARIDTQKTAPGLTFISGLFNGGNEMRLISQDGSVVQRWPVRFTELFPDASHIEPRINRPNTDWHTDIHGAIALSDGSVVFNFEYNGMVKLDRCGAVQWTVPRMTHHSIEQSSDGSFWVGGRQYEEGVSEFPPLQVPYEEDTVLRISENGDVLDEFSVPRVFFNSDLEYLLLSAGSFRISRRGRIEESKKQLVHLNDIEELSADLADLFPQFEAGDLLLSLRDRNLIMLVDPRTRRVKWHQTGPWIRQHDPDFGADGTISVFNNNTDGTRSGSVLGGSTIVVLDPEDRKAVVLYGAKPGQKMYTPVRGRHQNLPNGNILITESVAGRVFEVTKQGYVVWEFINRFDDDKVAAVNDAIRYPEHYFTVEDWAC